MFRCDGAFDRVDDSFYIWQRGVFVDRVVTDHDVGFADENRRGDHLIPQRRSAGYMRNDHLTNAAIFRVFLHDHEPPGLSHRFFNRGAVPWHD